MARTRKKEEKPKALRLMTDDEIDAYMEERIHRTGNINTRMSNKQREWTEAELQIRNMVILDMLKNGMSRPLISLELQRRWGINKTTACRYIRIALDALVEDNEEFIKEARDIAVNRLEGLMEDSIARGDRANALKAMDMLNKINGLYTEKVEVKGDAVIAFEFNE